jgi:hypothetical protein
VHFRVRPDGKLSAIWENLFRFSASLIASSIVFFFFFQGSGKTHTMTGSSGDQRGIIPRSIELVASRQTQLEAEGWTLTMELSFLEIYCETVKDLLKGFNSPGSSSNDSGNIAAKFKIVENDAGQHFVQGIEMVLVDPADTVKVAALLAHAGRLRSVTATAMNASSSRSHAVLTLHTTAVHAQRGVTLKGQVNLVDLAGSERVEKSAVTGQALTEATRINASLSALSGVFLALGQKKAGRSHVPYRDSKLTELLRPALDANGSTLMLLHLSPLESSLAESLSALRFGATVGAVELGKAKRFATATTILKPAHSPTHKSGATAVADKSADALRGHIRAKSPVRGTAGSSPARIRQGHVPGLKKSSEKNSAACNKV